MLRDTIRQSADESAPEILAIAHAVTPLHSPKVGANSESISGENRNHT
jgi:hypothetical protein